MMVVFVIIGAVDGVVMAATAPLHDLKMMEFTGAVFMLCLDVLFLFGVLSALRSGISLSWYRGSVVYRERNALGYLLSIAVGALLVVGIAISTYLSLREWLSLLDFR